MPVQGGHRQTTGCLSSIRMIPETPDRGSGAGSQPDDHCSTGTTVKPGGSKHHGKKLKGQKNQRQKRESIGPHTLLFFYPSIFLPEVTSHNENRAPRRSDRCRCHPPFPSDTGQVEER